MELWEIGAFLGGMLIAGIGAAGLVWWYLLRGVPGKKEFERVLREVYC